MSLNCRGRYLLLLICFVFVGQPPVNAAPTTAIDLTATKSAVEVYPPPPGMSALSQYTVQVVENGKVHDSFVYLTQNPAFLPNGQPSGTKTSSTLEHNTSWTSFSANVPVTVRVTNPTPFRSARVLPTSAGIVPTISGNTISFPMAPTGHQQVSIDFCYTSTTCDDATDTDIANPLLVFMNPLEGSASPGALMATPGTMAHPGTVPPLSGQGMVYFGPGVYDLGTTPYVLGSDQTAFLAGGAYVMGMFSIADGAVSTTIEGRGVLSGELVQRSSCNKQRYLCPQMIGGTDIAGNALIQGITIVNSTSFNILLGGTHNTVRDIKVMSWYNSTDGISVANSINSEGSLIVDSFFKVGDDAIKLYSSNLLVSGCTIWQLNTSAAFEMGVNLHNDQSNITVQNSDVIRMETNWIMRTAAFVSGALGGNAKVSNYNFSNINVENTNFQLFQIAVIPNNYTALGNNSLGSITNLNFSNIRVTDPQAFPNMFQNFDLDHTVSNITFDNVSVAGQTLPSPTPTFNANRNFSVNGTVFSSLLIRDDKNPQKFLTGLFSGQPNGLPILATIAEPELTANFEEQAKGDFYGDGYESVLYLNKITGVLGLWKDPYLTNAEPWDGQYYPLRTINGQSFAPITTDGILRDGVVAGVGDFNGDGHTDILLWNATTEIGTILLMDGEQIIGRFAVRPIRKSNWKVAGIGDFQQSGYSDIVLRDSSGNVEILYFGETGLAGSADFAPSNFTYTKPTSTNCGCFDTSWDIAGVGDFDGFGYAEILWQNFNGQVALTNFYPNPTLNKTGQNIVFAQIPSSDYRIMAFGDYNGDGTKDILFYNHATKELSIWYMGWFNGAHYQQGPTFSP